MVSKKYLCSAPHPSTWDERAATLLESLGGDRAKREEVLNQTISALGDIIGEKQRSGPGRKSNAEHALSFYRHVLTLTEQEDTTHQMDRAKRADEKKDDEENKTDCDDTDDSSMDSVDFLDQHNDLCEVCNLGGELLCCSTCNLVFHLSCHRPILKQEPPDNWSCAYCIATGLTGYKREAKIRRRAQAAVRQMAKNKDNKGQDMNGDSDDEESEDVDRETNEEEEMEDDSEGLEEKQVTAPVLKAKSGMKVCMDKPVAQVEVLDERDMVDGDTIGDDHDRKKRKIEQSEEQEGIENTEERRERRQRRSPKLYDPQTCAASEWRSDGVNEWKSLGDEQNSDHIDDDGGGDAEEDSKGPVWCNFCMDDPKVPICCFCACRGCFGKHDKSKLLLCDKCDAEYHIYCLDPPLVTVPGSRKWFCPSCKNVPKGEKVEGGTTTNRSKATGTPNKGSPSEKRGPGRPRKPEGGDDLTPDKRVLGRARKSVDKTGTPSSTDRRGPGRPRKGEGVLPSEQRESGKSRKSVSPDDAAARRGSSKPKSSEYPSMCVNRGSGRSKKAEIDFSSPEEKRGPGRPKKEGEHETISHCKQRGRPFKSPSGSAQNKTVKRPKLSGSTKPEVNLSTSSDGGPQPLPRESPMSDSAERPSSRPGSSGSASPTPLAVQKSRSGRTVKSRTFHDEIDEGEQHLKVNRPSSSQDRPKKEEMVKAKTTLVLEVNDPDIDGPSVDSRTLAVASYPQLLPSVEPIIVVEPGISVPIKQLDPVLPPSPVSNPSLVLKPVFPSSPPLISSSSTAVPKAVTISTQKPLATVPGTTAESNIANVIKRMPDPLPVLPMQRVPMPTAIRVPVPLPHTLHTGSSQKVLTTAGEGQSVKVPRRKPGARECMQMSRRFGVQVIPQRYMTTLSDYCSRGKVEHLIRMRERLDDHSRLLELQLAGLEVLVKEKGELNITVPAQAESDADFDMVAPSPVMASIPIHASTTLNTSVMQQPSTKS